MKTGILTIILFISFSLMAQTKSTIHEKLKDLKEDAKKVSIVIEGKQIDFEGKEAAELLNQLKMVSKLKSAGDDELIWVTKNGDEKIKIISCDDSDDDVFFISTDLCDTMNSTIEEIEINEVDGVKEITITTTENGEKSTEALKGEEAEEYLKNNTEIILDIDLDKDVDILKTDGENLHKMKKGKIIKTKCDGIKKEGEKKIIIKKKIKTEEEE